MAELTARTRFAAPSGGSRASSPSLSPSRRHRRLFSAADEIPYDISPSSILEAFSDGTFPPPHTREHKYLLCAKEASLAQKATAIRVAKVALNAREWYVEMRRWNWPGTFDSMNGKWSFQDQMLLASLSGRTGSEVGSLEYWGSLPAVLVENYEQRIEEMQDEMEKLDIEELKGYIGEIHGSRSRPTSSYETGRTQLDLMDDFSLLITGTLVQALPNLSQLNQSIETWNIRLSILRGVPAFEKDLDQAQRALRLAWDAIELPGEDETSEASVLSWKNAVDTILLVLKSKIAELGRRVDWMLDLLEAREDVISEAWIDDFEELEADYSKWDVEAQRRGLELDLRLMKNSRTSARSRTTLDTSDGLPSRNKSNSALLNSASNPTAYTAPGPSLDMPDGTERTLVERGSPPARSTVSQEQTVEQTLADENRFEIGTPLEDSTHFTANDTENLESKPTMLKRASITSIESFTRAQLKSITIRRNSSSSSISSSEGQKRYRSREPRPAVHIVDVDHTPQSPRERQPHSSSPLGVTEEESAAFNVDDNSDATRPRTPIRSITTENTPLQSSGVSGSSSPVGPVDDSPSMRRRQSLLNDIDAKPPPLNSAMTKRRGHRDHVPVEVSLKGEERDLQDSEIVNEVGGSSVKSPIKSPIKSGTTDLNAQISDILTTVPANIRLRCSIDIDESDVDSFRHPFVARASQRLHASRASVKSPELTLAPANLEEQHSHRRGGDPEIKIYHLIQPGRDKPIKLFIRTVGENGERVMVRVGGGWADLGEYLRQYAEHHGRRTISEGKLEVLAPGGETAASVVSPGAVYINKNPSRAGSASPAGTPKQTRDNMISTPSNLVNSTTAISTPDTATSTNSKGSWKGDEVGLAGPATKKLELSTEKREWIDSMMTQARRISGGVMKTPVPEKEFGDLGKIGGTKRVWLRAPSRQGGGE